MIATENLNLKEFIYIEGTPELKKKNWENYIIYLNKNHPLYKKYSKLNYNDINKELNKTTKNLIGLKGEELLKRITIEHLFLKSLIECLNYGRSFKDSIENAMLHTINKKSREEYKNLIFNKDKEDYF